jgi:hypothetical protein
MSEVARSPVPASSSGVLAWWAHHSHRYVLPAAGAATLALGLSAALDAHAVWGAYAPPLLLALGVGTLATGLARLAVRKPPVPVAPPVPERSSAESWVICPSCNARGFDVVTPETAKPWWETHPSMLVAAPAGPFADPGPPGDFLWGSWVPTVGRMPVELVGPVPETAYVPHRPGAPSLYEEGEPIILDLEEVVEVPSESTPTVSSPDAPSPMLVGVEATERRVLTAPLGPNPPPPGPPLAPVRSVGIPIEDRVLHEALNPTPPHLRPEPVYAASAPGLRPVVATSASPDGCANCAAPVLHPKSWRRCTECLRQMCAKCMMTAFLTLERAWCSRCAELRSFDTLSEELAPRSRAPSDRWGPEAGGEAPYPPSIGEGYAANGGTHR